MEDSIAWLVQTKVTTKAIIRVTIKAEIRMEIKAVVMVLNVQQTRIAMQIIVV
jgi:hypothetical protein